MKKSVVVGNKGWECDLQVFEQLLISAMIFDVRNVI